MNQTSSTPIEKGVALPPKLSYQLIHKRERAVETAAQQSSELDEEEEPVQQQTVSKQGPKQVKLSTSKIDGVAHPRKPRIGPQYQAVVPEWPVNMQQKPPEATISQEQQL